MGRKYKKKIPSRLPKKIPTVFQCPSCGKKAVRVEIDRENNIANVSCGSCKISVEIKIPPICNEVDAYGKFVDMVYSGEIIVEG